MHSLWSARDLLAIMSVSEKIIGNSMKTFFIFCVKNGSGLFSYSPSPYSTVWRTCNNSAAAERSYSPSTSRLWDRRRRITYERPTWMKVYADLYSSSSPSATNGLYHGTDTLHAVEHRRGSDSVHTLFQFGVFFAMSRNTYLMNERSRIKTLLLYYIFIILNK